MDYQVTDVLIVGAGGAGLRAAIELHKRGTSCLVIGKSKKRDAHTKLAAGGINAALGTMDRQDNWKIHFADTIKEGQYLADYRMVETLCKNAPSAIKELVKWGVDFHREPNGKITQRFFGAAQYRRACFVGDYTGKAILNALTNEVDRRDIDCRYQVYITSLLQHKGKVCGALGIDLRKGKFVVFQAKAVLLATGGHSRVYKRSSSRILEGTGDGVTLGYEAGCTLMDMELIQFHPTGMLYPKSMEGQLVTEAVRGEGGKLFNKNNERFMKKYDPKRMELSARDVVALSNYLEITHGRGTRHEGVWLDITSRPLSYLRERLPTMVKQFKHYANIDISKQRMEVAPTSHYSMGGIAIDHTTYETGVEGLYAVGEVTSGVHGANRLGGNSLAEIMVFGRLIGKKISQKVKRQKHTLIDLFEIDEKMLQVEHLLGKGIYKPSLLRKEMQEMMWIHAGVMRDEKSLKKGLAKLNRMKKKIQHMKIKNSLKMNEDLVIALDVQNMVVACEAILRCALLRRESRGGHNRREQRKQKDPSYQVNFMCCQQRGKMHITKQKVAEIPWYLLQYVEKQGETSKRLLE